MSLKILDTCINCDVCEDKCPNNAIYMGEDIFHINASKCTECVGHYDEAQGVVFCPVDCIVKDPSHNETQESLLAKFKSMHIREA